MSNIRLFQLKKNVPSELKGETSPLEKPLQRLIERNLECFFGIRFLASEHPTGDSRRGRIDTLGLDDDDCPVIIEYKKERDQDVLSQGLAYLSWLMDHKGDFEVLVQRQLGNTAAKSIQWEGPRLILIASDFFSFQSEAIKTLDHNIELIRYQQYPGAPHLLLFEHVSAFVPSAIESIPTSTSASKKRIIGKTKGARNKTFTQSLDLASQELRDLFDALKEFCESRGGDVYSKPTKRYYAFRHFENFASVVIRHQTNKLIVYLKIDPKSVRLEKGFSRDMTKTPHWGTGDLELTVSTPGQLRKAKSLIQRAYDEN